MEIPSENSDSFIIQCRTLANVSPDRGDEKTTADTQVYHVGL